MPVDLVLLSPMFNVKRLLGNSLPRRSRWFREIKPHLLNGYMDPKMAYPVRVEVSLHATRMPGVFN
jgi:hypothetical protein